MKSVGQIMEELGFKKDAPDSVKRALIKNLVAAANSANPRNPIEAPQEEPKVQPGEQLSFNFGDAS